MKIGRDRGFTLLELLIVVIIIGIVLTLSYPSLSRGSTTLRLHATGRDILNTFRYAREKAVTEQTGMRVTIDREKQTLLLTDIFGEGNRIYSLPQDVKIQGLKLAGAEMPNNPLTVRFSPNGSSDRAEVLLKSKTGSVLRVITDPITGGARIERGEGENLP
jgi:prepilin-type N-terminal cleavage/methylation domain-containing protein